MTQPSRRAIFSWRALTASAAEVASADKSNGPPVVAQKPIEAGSTNIEIVMATSNTQECIVVALFYPSNRIPEHRRAVTGDTGRRQVAYFRRSHEIEKQSVPTPKAWGAAEDGASSADQSMLSRWDLPVDCLREGAAKACMPLAIRGCSGSSRIIRGCQWPPQACEELQKTWPCP